MNMGGGPPYAGQQPMQMTAEQHQQYMMQQRMMAHHQAMGGHQQQMQQQSQQQLQQQQEGGGAAAAQHQLQGAPAGAAGRMHPNAAALYQQQQQAHHQQMLMQQQQQGMYGPGGMQQQQQPQPHPGMDPAVYQRMGGRPPDGTPQQPPPQQQLGVAGPRAQEALRPAQQEQQLAAMRRLQPEERQMMLDRIQKKQMEMMGAAGTAANAQGGPHPGGPGPGYPPGAIGQPPPGGHMGAAVTVGGQHMGASSMQMQRQQALLNIKQEQGTGPSTVLGGLGGGPGGSGIGSINLNVKMEPPSSMHPGVKQEAGIGAHLMQQQQHPGMKQEPGIGAHLMQQHPGMMGDDSLQQQQQMQHPGLHQQVPGGPAGPAGGRAIGLAQQQQVPSSGLVPSLEMPNQKRRSTRGGRGGGRGGGAGQSRAHAAAVAAAAAAEAANPQMTVKQHVQQTQQMHAAGHPSGMTPQQHAAFMQQQQMQQQHQMSQQQLQHQYMLQQQQQQQHHAMMMQQQQQAAAQAAQQQAQLQQLQQQQQQAMSVAPPSVSAPSSVPGVGSVPGAGGAPGSHLMAPGSVPGAPSVPQVPSVPTQEPAATPPKPAGPTEEEKRAIEAFNAKVSTMKSKYALTVERYMRRHKMDNMPAPAFLHRMTEFFDGTRQCTLKNENLLVRLEDGIQGLLEKYSITSSITEALKEWIGQDDTEGGQTRKEQRQYRDEDFEDEPTDDARIRLPDPWPLDVRMLRVKVPDSLTRIVRSRDMDERLISRRKRHAEARKEDDDLPLWSARRLRYEADLEKELEELDRIERRMEQTGATVIGHGSPSGVASAYHQQHHVHHGGSPPSLIKDGSPPSLNRSPQGVLLQPVVNSTPKEALMNNSPPEFPIYSSALIGGADDASNAHQYAAARTKIPDQAVRELSLLKWRPCEHDRPSSDHPPSVTVSLILSENSFTPPLSVIIPQTYPSTAATVLYDRTFRLSAPNAFMSHLAAQLQRRLAATSNAGSLMTIYECYQAAAQAVAASAKQVIRSPPMPSSTVPHMATPTTFRPPAKFHNTVDGQKSRMVY